MVKKQCDAGLSRIESFKALYETHFAALCLYANKYVGDYDICIDIVQDGYVKLWKHLHKYDSHNAMISFMYVTIRNRALNLIRHEQVKQKMFDVREKKDVSLELEIIENEAKRILWNNVSLLPDKYKLILSLELQGYSLQEIALKLDRSVQTIKNNKALAIGMLKDKFGK